MAELAYNYPAERHYIFCGRKEHWVATEVCEICKHIKGCLDMAGHLAEMEASKSEGEP